MTGNRILLCCLVVVGLCLGCVAAKAHGIVGKRLFIEPLVTEDANPKNELALPVFEAIRAPEGHFAIFNYSLEYKLSSPFSLSFENSYRGFHPVPLMAAATRSAITGLASPASGITSKLARRRNCQRNVLPKATWE